MTNDPNASPGVCPFCGATAEDLVGYGAGEYECPECGERVAEDEIMTAEEFKHYNH